MRLKLLLPLLALCACATTAPTQGDTDDIKHYCGKVVRVLPIYNTSEGPSPAVMLYVPHLDRTLVIPCSWYTYSHAPINGDTCFVLSRRSAGE
jgi:hypothetical protein